MKQIRITLTTLAPVVMTATNQATVMTETQEAISGSVLRGMLAARYIEIHGLGKEAHRDERFRRLFFGGLRFVDANVTCASTGARSFVIPFSMQKEKEREGVMPQVEDLMRTEKATRGMKPLRGYAVLKGEHIRRVSVRKNISLHMSRGSEEERRLGRSDAGKIYNYEALEAGQTFSGRIFGSEEDLTMLTAGLAVEEKGADCWIGRSKFTQYGHCTFQLSAVEDVPVPALAGTEEIILRLDTALIPPASSERLQSAAEILTLVADVMAERTGKEHFSIERVHAAGTTVENYVGIWNMRRPSQMALAAGTVFALKKDTPWTDSDMAALASILYEGIGQRTAEGYGQLRVWPQTAGLYAARPKDHNAAAESSLPQEVSPEVAAMARRILDRRIREQIRIYAAEDAYDNETRGIDGGMAGKVHFFVRLDNMLSRFQDSASCRKEYRDCLDKEVREKSPLDRSLRNIHVVGERTLHDLLREEGIPQPYGKRDWTQDMSGHAPAVVTLMKEIGMKESNLNLEEGKYFYEYWHWFFRYARKKALTDKQKGGQMNA